MTDIQTLAIRTAGRCGITDEAAEGALEEYARQIEALEDRQIDRDNIDADDADFLAESVARAQRAGDLGQRELHRVEETLPEVERAQALLADAESQRNDAIRAALNAGARVKDVAAAAGLSRQRVEQIRGA